MKYLLSPFFALIAVLVLLIGGAVYAVNYAKELSHDLRAKSESREIQF